MEKAENRRVTLQVWSSKRQELRDVDIVPARAWSVGPAAASAPSDNDEPSLLGLSLRLCNVDAALDRVWHILDVIDGSPAQDAGLVPYTDYVIGSAEGVLRNEGDFYHLVESHVDRPLRLFCWNSDLDVLRQVIIVPNRSWRDGKGLLGAGVGFGLLHRIPKPSDRPAVLEEMDLPEDGDEDIENAQSAAAAYGVEDDPEWAASSGVSVIPVDEPRASSRTSGRAPTIAEE